MTLRALMLGTIAGLLAACSGGDGKRAPTAAPSSLSSATAATTTPQTGIPDKPVAFEDYSRAIASYMSAKPAAATECLSDVYAKWQMPLPDPVKPCWKASLDADPAPEIAAVIAETVVWPSPISNTRFKFVVFDRTESGYRVAYESPPGQLPPSEPGATNGPILAVRDLTGAGTDNIVLRSDACETSTCTSTIHVLGLLDGDIGVLPAAGDGISMSALERANVTEAGAIVLTGRGQETTVTGPQRGATVSWTWDGAAFAVSDRRPAMAEYLYHAVLDADALLALGDYAGAQAAFIAAVDDKRLKVWRAETNERAEIEAYALFRAGVGALLAGDQTTATTYLDRAKAYANTLHAQLARSFQAGYSAKDNISVGCAAVRDDLRANAAEYAVFWDFGTANPRFDPATVCPY